MRESRRTHRHFSGEIAAAPRMQPRHEFWPTRLLAHFAAGRRLSGQWRALRRFDLVRAASTLLSSAKRLGSELFRDKPDAKLCLVVHDALCHGAQYLALHLAQTWSKDLHIGLEIVLLGDGPLKARFAACGRVHDLSGAEARGPRARDLAQRLAARGVHEAVCNSAASGDFLATLTEAGIRCVCLVHEMPGAIAQFNLLAQVQAVRQHAALAVFPSPSVRDTFPAGPTHASQVRPQGLYKRNALRTPEERNRARRKLREQFGLHTDAPIVIGVGYGDARKGVDLFVEVAGRVAAGTPNAGFIWVGAMDPPMQRCVDAARAAARLEGNLFFAGFQEATDAFYAGADAFALTSREDPFPTVLMEALDAGLPFVAFTGAGGFDALLEGGCGIGAPAFDTDAFARAIGGLLSDPQRRREMGELGRELVRREYSFRRYAFDIAALACVRRPRVSVIVPSFDYGAYLPGRIGSILKQAYPVYEVLIADDASSDDSVAVARALLGACDVDHEIMVNATNGGSAFRQWLVGAHRVRGDIVWIAEADDLSEPNFLAAAIGAFTDAGVVMSYTQSKMIDAAGAVIGPDYLGYVSDIDDERWRRAHVAEGEGEIREVLAVRNTVPNVSACLFRRPALVEALGAHIEEIAGYSIAGDWAAYVRVLEKGRISFHPRALNLHRRHEGGLTIGAKRTILLGEILAMQAAIRARYTPSAKATRLAHAYAQRLYEEFGLASAKAPQVADHPDFARLLQAGASTTAAPNT